MRLMLHSWEATWLADRAGISRSSRLRRLLALVYTEQMSQRAAAAELGRHQGALSKSLARFWQRVGRQWRTWPARDRTELARLLAGEEVPRDEQESAAARVLYDLYRGHRGSPPGGHNENPLPPAALVSPRMFRDGAVYLLRVLETGRR